MAVLYNFKTYKLGVDLGMVEADRVQVKQHVSSWKRTNQRAQGLVSTCQASLEAFGERLGELHDDLEAQKDLYTQVDAVLSADTTDVTRLEACRAVVADAIEKRRKRKFRD